MIPGVSQAAISPDGNQIAVARTAGRGSIQVFDRRSNVCKLLPTAIKPVASLRWMPDNEHLACSFHNDENDLAIVNVKTNTLRTTRTGAASLRVLASPEGKNLLCLGSDRCLRWVEVASLNTIKRVQPIITSGVSSIGWKEVIECSFANPREDQNCWTSIPLRPRKPAPRAGGVWRCKMACLLRSIPNLEHFEYAILRPVHFERKFA